MGCCFEKRIVFKGMPFFLKQWGGRNKKKKGRTYDAMPKLKTWDQNQLNFIKKDLDSSLNISR